MQPHTVCVACSKRVRCALREWMQAARRVWLFFYEAAPLTCLLGAGVMIRETVSQSANTVWNKNFEPCLIKELRFKKQNG